MNKNLLTFLTSLATIQIVSMGYYGIANFNTTESIWKNTYLLVAGFSHFYLMALYIPQILKNKTKIWQWIVYISVLPVIGHWHYYLIHFFRTDRQVEKAI